MSMFNINNKERKVKYIIVLSTIFLLFLITSPNSFYSFAVDTRTFDLELLANSIKNVISIFLKASAGALVIMIAYGIIKASLATGDPRGLEGAKSTWSYALFGFFVIVLSWFLILFIRRLLGMSAGSDLSPGGFIDDIKTEIQSLIEVGHSSSSGN